MKTLSLCRKIALGMFAAAAVGSAYAVPANDDFDNAIYLNDLPSTPQASHADTGSNVDATAQVDEPIPNGYTAGNYQGTVWYYWYPDASGWYEINTTGSSIDTVLGVWLADVNAPALNTLTQVHVNDNDIAGGTSSRVVFYADSSNLYYFTVASKTATRGAYSFAMSGAPDPLITTSAVTGTSIDSMVFNPASPNVSSSAVSVTATVTMGIRANITTGSLRIFDSAKAFVTSVPLTIADRQSGGNFSGVYQVSFNLAQGLPAGSYRWALHLENQPPAGSPIQGSVGWEELTPIPTGISQTFTVISAPPSNGYATWLSSYSLSGTGTAKDEDFDHDGIQNLAEYAFGLDPKVPSEAVLLTSGASIVQNGLPKVTVVGSGASQRLRVEYVKKQGDGLLTLTVRFSDDMVAWTDAVNIPAAIASGGGYDVLSVEDQVFFPVKTRRFVQITAAYAAP